MAGVGRDCKVVSMCPTAFHKNVDSFTVPIETNLFGFVYLNPMQVKHCPDWKQRREIEWPDAKMATSGLTSPCTVKNA